MSTFSAAEEDAPLVVCDENIAVSILAPGLPDNST